MITKKEELYNKRIHVTSPKESKRIQERGFELGFLWQGKNDKTIQHTDKPYLSFWDDNKMTYGTNEHLSGFENISIKELMQTDKPEYFEISGKPHHLEAIFKDLVNLGFTRSIYADTDKYSRIVLNYNKADKTNQHYNQLTSAYSTNHNTQYNLPEDWSKVIEAAKDFLNHPYWKEDNFKVGDFVVFLDKAVKISSIDTYGNVLAVKRDGSEVAPKTSTLTRASESQIKEFTDYKEGDYVILLEKVDNGNIKSFITGNIYKLGGRHWKPNCNKFYVEADEYGSPNGCYDWKFRLATKDEIKKINEIKVGDYFVCIKEQSGYNGKLNTLYKCFSTNEYGNLHYKEGSSIHKDRCRKATKQEIEKYNNIEVEIFDTSGYKTVVKIDSDRVISAEGNSFTIKEFEGIYPTTRSGVRLSTWSVNADRDSVSNIILNIGCKKFTYKELNKIKEAYYNKYPE